MTKAFYPAGDKWIAVEEITSLWEFLKAVPFSEKWLQCLAAFHIGTLLCITSTRKYVNFQLILFICLLGLAFASEQLNALGAKYWRMFAKDQYFDSAGLFITVVYSAPLLLNCLVLMILWLWTAGKMLIVVKRGQLREQIRRQAEEKKEK